MPVSTRSSLDEGNRILRELAVQQGLAYRNYGETLLRFGADEIGWAELLKSSSDMYFRQAVQTIWSLVWANATLYAWLLSVAGAKPLRPEMPAEHHEAPAGKRTQRGRG